MNETISAQVRTVFGKKAGLERKTGTVPAVLYGPDLKKPVALFIQAAEFQKTFARARYNTPITIAIKAEKGGDEEHKALIHDVSLDSVRGQIQHVDFYQFSAKKKVRVDVPVMLSGVAPVQKQGALIMKNIESIEVECSPLHIPEHIVVDVSGLVQFDQTIYIKDLTLPEGVIIHVDAELPVVSAVPPISEAELAAMEDQSKKPVKELELAGKKEKPEEEAQEEQPKPGKSQGKAA